MALQWKTRRRMRGNSSQTAQERGLRLGLTPQAAGRSWTFQVSRTMPGALAVEVDFLQPVASHLSGRRRWIPPTVRSSCAQSCSRAGQQRCASDHRGVQLGPLTRLLAVDVEAKIIDFIPGAPVDLKVFCID